MQNETSNNLNILILGPLNFPRPSAPTTRVTTYAKGMMNAGAKVQVLCLRPAGQGTIPPQGCAQGIPYIYCAGVTTYQKNKLKQIYFEIKAFWAAIALLIKFHRQQRIDAILFYAAHIYHEVSFSILAKLLGITIIRDICEYPFYYDRSNNLRLKIKGYLYERLVFPLFDALIIMTRALEDYCKPFMRKNARYLMVPIMVDPDRFENVEPIAVEGRYIAYCGDPAGTKDGVDILIEAFAKIAPRHPDVFLYIIGDTANRHDPDFLKKLQHKINEKSGTDHIILTGRVNYEDIPKYISGACALVLARPQSIQAKYGFPTKLGEYLATGNPVLVTNVGEIPDFIKDCENGYMVEPNDAEVFADKLDYILSHPDLSHHIGQKGRTLALNHFCYRKHGYRLVEFIRDIC